MKKKQSNWYTAATHFLTAGFAIPMIIFLLTGFVIGYIGFDITQPAVQMIINIIWLASIWLGVMYSANYLARANHIENASEVVVLSTIYRIVLILPFIALYIFALATNSQLNSNQTIEISVNLLFTIIGTLLFYWTSKKYVKSDGPFVETNPPM